MAINYYCTLEIIIDSKFSAHIQDYFLILKNEYSICISSSYKCLDFMVGCLFKDYSF